MRAPADPDFGRYLDARWPDFVGALEDDGVEPSRARLATAETMVAARASWRRRVEGEQVDVTLWAHARERAGLEPRPGEPVPHGVGTREPDDGPEAWLERAVAARSARRRRSARRGVVALAALAALGAGWGWWASRPPPIEVRREANPLPVTWYARGELHLAEVVVGLPDVEEFVAWGSGAAVRLRSGEVVRVDRDGDVHDAEAPDSLDDPPDAPPPFLALGQYDVLVESVPVPGGGWAHLIDSSRRDGAQDAVRRSESGRRALVVCDADLSCAEPRTIVETDGTIRLR